MNNQPSNAAPPKFVHWFSFKKLPPEIQQRLLNLQNGEGDYYKRKQPGSGCFIAIVVGFIFVWFNVFSLFAPIVPPSGFVFVFLATFLVFLVTSYFVIHIIADSRIPLKPHTFITPTQAIESNGDIVRAANIAAIQEMTHVVTTNRKGGRFSKLELKFPDRSILSFSVSGGGEANQIIDKINAWNNRARGAVLQGDQSYFQRHDIFQGISANDLHLYAFERGCLRQFLVGGWFSLLFAALIVLPFFGYVWYRADVSDWDRATKNGEENIYGYSYYLKNHPYALHRQEAEAALARLYGEVIERTKAQTDSGADPAAIELLTRILEDAKGGAKNEIGQFYEPENKISADAEKKLNAKLGGAKILPLHNDLTETDLTTFSLGLVSRFKSTFPERAIWLDNYNKYVKDQPADLPVLRIKYAVAVNETDKPALTIKTYDKETVFYPQMTINFDCTLTAPGKLPYQYDLKVVPTPDFTVYSKTDSAFYQNLLKKAFGEFEKDFARRFGLKEAEPEKSK